jgi:hypothetical protein
MCMNGTEYTFYEIWSHLVIITYWPETLTVVRGLEGIPLVTNNKVTPSPADLMRPFSQLTPFEGFFLLYFLWLNCFLIFDSCLLLFQFFKAFCSNKGDLWGMHFYPVKDYTFGFFAQTQGFHHQLSSN